MLYVNADMHTHGIGFVRITVCMRPVSMVAHWHFQLFDYILFVSAVKFNENSNGGSAIWHTHTPLTIRISDSLEMQRETKYTSTSNNQQWQQQKFCFHKLIPIKMHASTAFFVCCYTAFFVRRQRHASTNCLAYRLIRNEFSLQGGHLTEVEYEDEKWKKKWKRIVHILQWITILSGIECIFLYCCPQQMRHWTDNKNI